MEDSSDSQLNLKHEEFLQYLELGKIEFYLPKNLLLKIFYILPVDRWRQIVLQVILILLWGSFIFGLICIYKKMWLLFIVSIFAAWNINIIKRIFVQKSIKKGLKQSSDFYYHLMQQQLIKIILN